MFQQTTKTYNFVICALRVDTGQCIYSQDFHVHTFARLKKLIYSLPNYK